MRPAVGDVGGAGDVEIVAGQEAAHDAHPHHAGVVEPELVAAVGRAVGVAEHERGAAVGQPVARAGRRGAHLDLGTGRPGLARVELQRVPEGDVLAGPEGDRLRRRGSHARSRSQGEGHIAVRGELRGPADDGAARRGRTLICLAIQGQRGHVQVTVDGSRPAPGVVEELDGNLPGVAAEVAADGDVLPGVVGMAGGGGVDTADLDAVDQHPERRVALVGVLGNAQDERVVGPEHGGPIRVQHGRGPGRLSARIIHGRASQIGDAVQGQGTDIQVPVGAGRATPRIVDEGHRDPAGIAAEVAGQRDRLPGAGGVARGRRPHPADLPAIDAHGELRVALVAVLGDLEHQGAAKAEDDGAGDVERGGGAGRHDRNRVRSGGAGVDGAVQGERGDVEVAVGRGGAAPRVVQEGHRHLVRVGGEAAGHRDVLPRAGGMRGRGSLDAPDLHAIDGDDELRVALVAVLGDPQRQAARSDLAQSGPPSKRVIRTGA